MTFVNSSKNGFFAQNYRIGVNGPRGRPVKIIRELLYGKGHNRDERSKVILWLIYYDASLKGNKND